MTELSFIDSVTWKNYKFLMDLCVLFAKKNDENKISFTALL